MMAATAIACHAGDSTPTAVTPNKIILQPQYPCTQNCPPGDEKCLQACPKPAATGNTSSGNFACLNQCTRAGYGYSYCKNYCAQ